MNYIVAIPSYDRIELIQNYSLKVLHEQGVPKEKIYIFVVEEEYIIYKNKLIDFQIIIGKKGLLAQMNFITDYFAENTPIFIFHDDVKEIFKKKHKKTPGILRSVISETLKIDLNSFIISAFERAKELNLNMWGLNKTSNPFLMTDNTTTDLRLIIAPVYGFFNKKDSQYQYKISNDDNYTAEDVEKTILYYKADGGVLRFNEYGFKTGKLMAKGGIASEMTKQQRLQKTLEMNQLMMQEYGNYGVLVPNKNQGEVIRLIRNPKKN
jgi:hypothetical protein